MEIEVKEQASLEDGVHTGKISKVEFRHDPYEYTDVYLKPEGKEFEVKYGCPTNVTEKSKLGRLLSKFGELKVGKRVDPEKVLVGKAVTFQTITESTPKGDFVRVVDDSIKPIAEPQRLRSVPLPGCKINR